MNAGCESIKKFFTVEIYRIVCDPQCTPLFASQQQADGCDNQSFNKETFTKHGKKILKMTVER